MEQWAAGADAVCRQAAPAAQTAVQAWTSGQIDFVTYVHEIGDIAFEIASILRDLDAPANRTGDVDRYIALWQDAGQAMRDGATAFMQGNEPGIQQASSRYDQAILRGLEIARSLGALDCVLLGGG